MARGRVYLPLTASLLARARDAGGFDAATPAHAVTERLADELGTGDEEDLEHAASTGAALDALLLMGADDPPRRVVAAAEPVDWEPRAGADETASAVTVTGGVPLRLLAAVLADSTDAAEAVTAARDALAARADVDDAAVQRCLDHDLGWYAAQELDQLLTELSGG